MRYTLLYVVYMYIVQIASLSPSSCVSPVQLTDGGGGVGKGAGLEPDHRTAIKLGPL